VKLHEIDTPALLLDLDATERNLAKMARFLRAGIAVIVDSSVPPEVRGGVGIWVHFSNATVNQHDRLYGVRNGVVETVVRLQG
jgi:D-serine deaminase-like pyridoxal phosphate-dependent protein